MTKPLSGAAQRIQDVLAARGLPHQVIEFTQTTRSAADAAAAIGCTVAQIAKSIVFKTSSSAPVLVIASGSNRVDEAKVAAAIGEPIGKADADFVRAATGFAIGGVPPLGHAQPLRTLIDRDLLALPTIWAAAGTPNAVFQLTPEELVGMTGGQAADIAQRRS
ncbi:MAG TPA: YbaK/EbsC family protein [Alphaproteobacteria bacterium]|nr:YbaK/EbsC family protein [Alphaproteobacteria bacterium]